MARARTLETAVLTPAGVTAAAHEKAPTSFPAGAASTPSSSGVPVGPDADRQASCGDFATWPLIRQPQHRPGRFHAARDGNPVPACPRRQAGRGPRKSLAYPRRACRLDTFRLAAVLFRQLWVSGGPGPRMDLGPRTPAGGVHPSAGSSLREPEQSQGSGGSGYQPVSLRHGTTRNAADCSPQRGFYVPLLPSSQRRFGDRADPAASGLSIATLPGTAGPASLRDAHWRPAPSGSAVASSSIVGRYRTYVSAAFWFTRRPP